MIDNPIIFNNYKPPLEQQLKMREEDPKKMIGDPSFYFKGFKHEKDRIEYAMKLNSGYDFTPIPKPHEFRQRQKNKEIQPSLRFQAKNSLERIESVLERNTQTQVENMDFKKLKKNRRKENFSSNLSVQEYLKLIFQHQIVGNKHIFLDKQLRHCCHPYIRKPTLKQQGKWQIVFQVISNQQYILVSLINHQSVPNIVNNSPTQGKKKNNSFDPIKCAKEILLKCNVTNKKYEKGKNPKKFKIKNVKLSESIVF